MPLIERTKDENETSKVSTLKPKSSSSSHAILLSISQLSKRRGIEETEEQIKDNSTQTSKTIIGWTDTNHLEKPKIYRAKTFSGDIHWQKKNSSLIQELLEDLSKPSQKFCRKTKKDSISTASSQSDSCNHEIRNMLFATDIFEHPKYKGFMTATVASQIKNQSLEIQSINKLFPPLRRGRSLSPRLHRRNKSKEPSSASFISLTQPQEKLPTIEQESNKDVLKQTNSFEEDLLNLHEVDLKKSLKSLESASNIPQPIDRLIELALLKLRSSDWSRALRGLAEIIQIAQLPESNIHLHMAFIYQKLMELLKNSRSHVARTACQAAGHLFEHVKDTRKPEFDVTVTLLLNKTADGNKFIRQDANLALDCMVVHMPSFQTIRVICAKGPTHKNPLVRIATARLLVCAVVIATSNSIYSMNEQTKKRVYQTMSLFLEDKSIEVRKFAERLYKVLCREADFESCLKKYWTKEQIMKVKRTIRRSLV